MSPIRTASMRARSAGDEALKSGAGMRCRVAKPSPACGQAGVACGHCPVFVSRACIGWQTSPCGPRLAEQRWGPPALLRTPMMRTAKPPHRDYPVAVCIRRLMAKRTSRAAAASDLPARRHSSTVAIALKDEQIPIGDGRFYDTNLSNLCRAKL
jgi:hypothetical protein